MKRKTVTELPAVAVLLAAFLAMVAACTTVKETPQEQTAYTESTYRGQVPSQTLQQLEEDYPDGFFEKKRAAVKEEEKLYVGITLFTGSGTVAGFTDQATEIFTTAFVRSGLFRVVEREKLDRLVAEVELGQTGLVDPASASQVGQLAGVQLLIAGNLSEHRGVQRIDVRVLDAATGEAVAAEKFQGPLDAESAGFLARRLVGRLAESYYGNTQ